VAALRRHLTATPYGGASCDPALTKRALKAVAAVPRNLRAGPDGRLIDIVPATPSIVGDDFSYRDWYRGVTTTGRPYVSAAYETAATGHARVVAAAVQVRASTGNGRPGKVLGVLVAAYDLDTVQRFVDQVSAAQGAQLTVTDQQGVLLASPGARSRGLLSRRHDPLVASALRGQGGVTEQRAAGAAVLSAYQPVPSIGWTVTADVASGSSRCWSTCSPTPSSTTGTGARS
jgi:two-component system sensor histidine kinase/response regulator